MQPAAVPIHKLAGEEDEYGGCFDEGRVIRAGWGCGEEMILGAVSTDMQTQ